MNQTTFVIIGAGQAGGWAAKTLRDDGFEGRLVLVGEEEYPPYERPPLSKEVLLGEAGVEKAFLWRPEELREQSIELRLGRRVRRIDRPSKTLVFEDGDTLCYDRLLLTTGSRVRRLEVPGAELAGIHYLRDIPDMQAIREKLSRGRRVLIVGGGWIGLEVAAAARKLGASVTVVEVAERLCSRALPPELSDFIQKAHEDQGVEVRCGTGVDRFQGNSAVERAQLSDGSSLELGMAVVGIGIVPNTELGSEAGLETQNGLVVNELCTTSDPDIFAAGDVTNHPNRLVGRRIRLESWQNAQNQAIAAAKSMLDQGRPYAEAPWFWSDQYDLNIQLVGLPEESDQKVVRGRPSSNRFTIFYLKGGRLKGASAINNGRDVRIAKKLIEAGVHVSAKELADESVKLQHLLKKRG